MLQKLIASAALTVSLMQGAMLTALPQLDISGEIFLVNRQFPISENYVPDTVVVNVSGTSRLMREDAARALEEMFAAAKSEAKIKFLTVSGYRSYGKQTLIYKNKVKNTGSKEKADEYVAVPGASEHQLGLAMDLGAKGVSSGLNGSFGKTKAGKWLVENAHRFGYIIRYQAGWEDITGYNYEPWHVRYVGVKHATAMFEKNIPMEKYVEELRLQALFDILEP